MESIRKIIREDKSWSSRARQIEIFHSGLMLKRPRWSVRKTAKVLGMCASTICEDLQLAKYLLEDSSLEKYKFRKDALEYIHE